MEQKGCCPKCFAGNNGGRHVAGCECHTSQNSGDWVKEMEKLPIELSLGGWSNLEDFIRLEIDRAERRVRDEVLQEIMEKEVQCPHCSDKLSVRKMFEKQ